MNQVIKCERYRLKRSKEILTMALILLAMEALSVGAYFAIQNLEFLKQMRSAFVAGTFFDGFTNSANSMIFIVLLIIMLASLVCKLYQFGINKQLVSSGIGRGSIIAGQFITFTTAFWVLAIWSSLTSGAAELIKGGSLGLDNLNIGRLLLSFLGMLVVVASLCALYLLIAHLTGSLGAAIALGLAIQMGLPSGVSILSSLLEMDFINDYYITTLQAKAISMDVPISEELIAIGVLVAISVVLVLLCQIVFRHKEIK